MKIIDFKLLEETVDKRLNFYLDNCVVSGANLYVYQEGQGELIKNYGYQNLESKTKMQSNSIYRVASMSKPITTVAIMREIEKGRVDLFDYIETFLPNFSDLYLGQVVDGKIEKLGKVQNRPRIIHLLTHTSGIGTDTIGNLFPGMLTSEDKKSLKNIVDFYAKQPLLFEPYSRSYYSSLAGFEILGRIVEVTSGKNFDDYLKEEVFNPIGMTDTTFAPNEEQNSRIVDMHMIIDKQNKVRKMFDGCVFEDIPYCICSGGAGLVSTLDDYSKFARMLLAKGMSNGNRILEEKTVRSFSISHVPDDILCGEKWSLGMRSIASKEYGRLEVGTFGWSGAYGTHFWVDPVNKICAVIMKNSAYDGGAGAQTSANFEMDVHSCMK